MDDDFIDRPHFRVVRLHVGNEQAEEYIKRVRLIRIANHIKVERKSDSMLIMVNSNRCEHMLW